jgi:YesN/AraC family two-component response regulator
VSIRILIVDDQDLIRTGFRLFLQTQEGLEVVGEAADGVEALEQSRTLEPDVVLMDIRMPRMDGVEAAARLSELASCSSSGCATGSRPSCSPTSTAS